MNSKEIKFDVLENAKLREIEQIRIDDNMIDESAKNRMFRNAQNKYNRMSGKKTENNNGDEFMEYVSGVEKIDTRKASRIVMTVGGIAAAFALVIGGAALLKGGSTVPPVPPEPFESVNTTVTSDTAEGTETVTTTTADTVTTTAAVSADITDNDVQTQSIDLQAVSTAKDVLLSSYAASSDESLWNIRYSMTDLNNDSVPELLVTADCLAGDPVTHLYFYNGSEYADSGEMLSNVKYCKDKNYVLTYGKMMRYAVYEATADNTLRLIEETDSSDYYNSVADFEVRYGVNGISSEYNWNETEYTFYADHNAAVVDEPDVLTIDVDFTKLSEQGIIPSDGRTYIICYNHLGSNNEDYGGGVTEPDTAVMSDAAGVVTRTVNYNSQANVRYGIELYDQDNDIRYSNICVADIDYGTGEITVISDQTNGAASFRFAEPTDQNN